MNVWILGFLLILGCVKRVGSYRLGCIHNKTSYKEGEIVRIEDPCLDCICQKRALECNFRVCEDSTNVLPEGCFLLHKPNECCPQLFCDKNFNSTGIELRTEYKVKSNLHETDCDINGSIFAEGSAVGSSQPCEYCYCFRGEIKCIKPRCLQFFNDCTPAFEKTSCCPTHYDCRKANVSVLTSQIKYFVSGSINFTVSNNSLRSLSSLSIEPGKKPKNSSDVMNIEEENSQELISNKTEERNQEVGETTVKPEREATVENYVTTIGFQAVKTEYVSDVPMIKKFTEESTAYYETDGRFATSSGHIEEEAEVQIRSQAQKFNTTETLTESNDESRENVSQVDDYDSYDYSEPRLPPSLPNLVIFPFVAADAVVKDKNEGTTEVANKDEIEKMDDTHNVFYNGYFFPAVKTEGGFIPKEPTKSEKPIHERSCLNKEQADLSSEGLKESPEASSQASSVQQPPKDTNFSTSVGVSQTKKPVTVTYKNFMVDFYPNYLITTTKGKKSQHPPHQPDTEEVIDLKIKTIQNAISPSDAVSEVPMYSSDAKNKLASDETDREISTRSTINSLRRAPDGDILTFEEFIKPFSLEEMTLKTTTTSASKKHKFSSKIKSQLFSVTSTTEHEEEKINQNVEPEVVTEGLSFPELLSSFSITEKSQIYIENQKLFKEEENSEQIVKTTETKKEKLGFFQPPKGGNHSREDKKSEDNGSEDGKNLVSLLGGTYLKLAGCNIYGMMYRVGKIIIELSGPCLECQCTDLGVQCRALKC